MRNYLTVLFMLLTIGLVGQPRFPALSPAGSIRQEVGLTTISVMYERPAARGRTIFGDLVPFGGLWRTGAGNCTKIKFNKNVVINNKILPSGTYSLLTIPGQNEWTIIFNSDTTLYGTQGYDESKDMVRLKTRPEISPRHYESFTVDIDVVQNDAEINLSWETTRVSFIIKTETEKQLITMITEDLLSGKIKDPQLLAMGAEYFYFLGRDLETGIALINKAIAYNTTSWYYAVKADLLTKSKRYAEAIETIKLNMAYVKTNPEKWTREQLDNVLEGQEKQLEDLQNKLKN